MRCLWFAKLNFSDKLQKIFELGLKKHRVFIDKSLSKKNYSEIKHLQTTFCCLCVRIAAIQIWRQTNSLWPPKGTQKIIQTVKFTDRKKFGISFYLKILGMIASTLSRGLGIYSFKTAHTTCTSLGHKTPLKVL